jgi:hypothetical protein
MKYIKNYKLFESLSDNIDYYLNLLETDKEEIKYILIDLIDMGYTVSYDMAFVGADGKSRIDKRSSENTPKLAIKLKAPSDINVQRSKYKDTKLLGTLTRITNHVINTFSDKCEVYYFFGGGSWDITYVLEFPVEKDNTKLKFDINDLREVLNQSLINDDDYSIDLHDSQLGFAKIKMNINNRSSKIEELLNKIDVDKDYADNEKECFDIIKKILTNLINNLNKKYNTKFDFESLGDNDNKDLSSKHIRNGMIYYLSQDGQQVEFLKLGYDSNFNEYKKNIKNGFFKRRDIFVGLEDAINIDFKLV